eukprot:TRINITY_DN1982_c0_g1_i1.p1 TRINITY_DN1982_c0_g1~~TRINITY_DN1982_c0_g1_i1.p1  ORF type:complete len:1148 (+),score=180.12 TRINITY_DN1982_c0_g1_i1:52-3495(+)
MGQSWSCEEHQLDTLTHTLSEAEKIEDHLLQVREICNVIFYSETREVGAEDAHTNSAPSREHIRIVPAPITTVTKNMCMLDTAMVSSAGFPQTQFNQAFYQIINRRFCWSEEALPDEAFQARANVKRAINLHCDQLLDWMTKQFLHRKVALAFESALKYASNPVVRSQTYEHFFRWLSSNLIAFGDCIRQLETGEDFLIVKRIMVLGLTDVWSAIRKSCANKIYQIIHRFTFDQLEEITKSLYSISSADGDDVTWQAKEGSLLGLLTIVRRFHWVVVRDKQGNHHDSIHKSSKDENGLREIVDARYMKFGDITVRGMPDFLRIPFPPLLFKMLSHPQLSIRESAVKAFSSFLYRSSSEVTLKTFHEIIIRLLSPCFESIGDLESIFSDETLLDALPPSWKTQSTQAQMLTKSESLYSLREDTEQSVESRDFQSLFSFVWSRMKRMDYLNAFESEGLLGLCGFLAKHTRYFFRIQGWMLYLFTFCHYLSHPASTVRQQSSAIFKCIVSKHCETSAVPFFLLDILSTNWMLEKNDVRLEQPKKDKLEETKATLGQSNCLLDPLRSSWEWKEGRLLAYELILNHLAESHRQFLIAPSSPRSEPTTPVSFISYQAYQEHESKTPSSILSTPTHGSRPGTPLTHTPGQPSTMGGLRRSISDEYICFEQESHVHTPKRGSVTTNAVGSILDFARENILNGGISSKGPSLLKSLLEQVAHSDSASQFELKRMAEQVIGPLSEVVFWVDPFCLVDMWGSAFSGESAFLRSACRSMRGIISLAVELERKKLRDGISKHIEFIIDQITKLLPSIREGINLSIKPSAIECLEVLFKYQASLGKTLTESESHLNFQVIWHYLYFLFVGGHSSIQLPQHCVPTIPQSQSFPAPLQKAQQAERIIINRCSSYLMDAAMTFTLMDRVRILPFIVQYVSIYEDSEACHLLLGAVACILNGQAQSFTEGEPSDGHLWIVSCDIVVQKMIPMVKNKSLEVATLRMILWTLESVCKIVCDLRHLPAICSAIVERMKQENVVDSIPQKLNAQLLQILSNDIAPQSSIHQKPLRSGPDSDIESEKSDSDWDNWDEEPEQSEWLIPEFGQFLSNLKRQSTGPVLAGPSDIEPVGFTTKLRTLAPAETKVITWLLEEYRAKIEPREKDAL